MKIGKNDFAIVWKPAKARFEWHLPNPEDKDSIVPGPFAVVAASVMRQNNKRFVKNMLDWLDKNAVND